eukprot:Skav203271  [mRNA]  locus=scaffold2987:112945:114055:+ [translate_table: standard]
MANLLWNLTRLRFAVEFVESAVELSALSSTAPADSATAKSLGNTGSGPLCCGPDLAVDGRKPVPQTARSATATQLVLRCRPKALKTAMALPQQVGSRALGEL